MSLASPALLRCATWKKKTPGALFLRKLLHKFLPVDKEARVARCGKLYHGHEDRCLTAVESKTRDYIESGRMLRSKAKRIVEQLDGSTPFRTRLEYIESLAALACVFPHDMSRKVTGANSYSLVFLRTRAARVALEQHSLAAHDPCRPELDDSVEILVAVLL